VFVCDSRNAAASDCRAAKTEKKMFSKIMLPIDLAHVDKLEKSLEAATSIAKANDSAIHAVGVTGVAPGAAAHDPEEYAAKLESFCDEQTEARRITFTPHSVKAVDVQVELDSKLREAASEIGADLIVMATHVPGIADHLFASHGGHLAANAKISVLLVR
jgi:nucleotide-binding universal stress UspA family protein